MDWCATTRKSKVMNINDCVSHLNTPSCQKSCLSFQSSVFFIYLQYILNFCLWNNRLWNLWYHLTSTHWRGKGSGPFLCFSNTSSKCIKIHHKKAQNAQTEMWNVLSSGVLFIWHPIRLCCHTHTDPLTMKSIDCPPPLRIDFIRTQKNWNDEYITVCSMILCSCTAYFSVVLLLVWGTIVPKQYVLILCQWNTHVKSYSSWLRSRAALQISPNCS